MLILSALPARSHPPPAAIRDKHEESSPGTLVAFELQGFEWYRLQPDNMELVDKVFRVPFLIAVALAIAFGGGILSAIWALQASAGFGAIRLGVWHAFPEAQTASADPYARSHRARAGRLLYGSAEGLVFTATEDPQGRRLNTGCTYRLHGRTPTARTWTLYAANAAGRPLPTPAALPSSFNARTVLRHQDGGFEILVSPEPQPGNWLALPQTGSFSLVLTLLDTPAAGSSGLIGLDMPELERIGCDNG
ncbi:hypothetical protein DFR48_107146 [Ciceribacter lividus]|uniref:DUF1214 domain-containing protein n=1 Tax=Ciceribacter lividus TaxID=1197950 RepID=A0A6I7HLA2_9HYPH|nr:hypothetical protein DFR48_107146 [Ciceribacter lividus]